MNFLLLFILLKNLVSKEESVQTKYEKSSILHASNTYNFNELKILVCILNLQSHSICFKFHAFPLLHFHCCVSIVAFPLLRFSLK